jgi:hypothetical protein
MSHQPSRRDLLKIAAAAIASLILPRNLFAGKPDKSFWFIHSDAGDSWPVADPVQWSLENARQAILERASERLLTLTPSDGERILRLVTRRCKLNLLELLPEQVVVHHWAEQGRADLRPFFKTHGLARREIEVVVRDRKKEVITTQSGDDYLYGERLLPFWPLNVFWLNRYLKKWDRRYKEESNDWTAAPGTWSGFGWKGIEPNLIPWAALKSAWRRAAPTICQNCDTPTILVNFGLPQCSMFNRETRFIHTCRNCRRLFEDNSIDRWKVGQWMVTNLDAEVWPDFDIFWGKLSKWEPPTVDTIPS